MRKKRYRKDRAGGLERDNGLVITWGWYPGLSYITMTLGANTRSYQVSFRIGTEGIGRGVWEDPEGV